MFMYSFTNGIRQGIRNIFKNGLFSLASIGTITASLFLFGVFYYTSAEEAWKLYKEKAFPEGDNEVLTNLDNDNPLAESASLEVYLNDASAQNDLVEFISAIPGVRKVNASESVANSFVSFGKQLTSSSGRRSW